jgi:hypothetical protein
MNFSDQFSSILDQELPVRKYLKGYMRMNQNVTFMLAHLLTDSIGQQEQHELIHSLIYPVHKQSCCILIRMVENIFYMLDEMDQIYQTALYIARMVAQPIEEWE